MIKARLQTLVSDPCGKAVTYNVLVSLLMVVGKTAAYLLTGSHAVLSDAVESVVHLVTMAFSSLSLWYARLPADSDHRYGHGKIAYFSSSIEALFIGGAAVGIFFIALNGFWHASALHQLNLGLVLLSLLALGNFFLGRFLVKVGRRYHSFILFSNGQHVLTDTWTTLGVMIGMFLAWATGIVWLDALVALFISFHLFGVAFSLLRKSCQALMDKIDEEVDGRIRQELDLSVERGLMISYHHLRHRKVEERLWIEVHLLFQEQMTIKEVHSYASNVEVAIMRAFPEEKVYITTHMEPEDHDTAHPDGHPELFNQF